MQSQRAESVDALRFIVWSRLDYVNAPLQALWPLRAMMHGMLLGQCGEAAIVGASELALTPSRGSASRTSLFPILPQHHNYRPDFYATPPTDLSPPRARPTISYSYIIHAPATFHHLSRRAQSTAAAPSRRHDALVWRIKVCAAKAGAPVRRMLCGRVAWLRRRRCDGRLMAGSGDGACGKTSLLNVFTRG